MAYGASFFASSKAIFTPKDSFSLIVSLIKKTPFPCSCSPCQTFGEKLGLGWFVPLWHNSLYTATLAAGFALVIDATHAKQERLGVADPAHTAVAKHNLAVGVASVVLVLIGTPPFAVATDTVETAIRNALTARQG